MSDSDLSSLSEAESVEFDDDVRNSAAGRGTIKSYFKAQNEPPPKKKRALSPPHEYVVADNSDIAVSLPPPYRTSLHVGAMAKSDTDAVGGRSSL